ncbi:hypothetical protein EfmAA242_04000 [Enterococcus faecium]|nr:hypothetical protein EfmAA242_04000 [Enterococcus faecium]
MYDGSHLPFKENILKTKAVVEYAHAHGVSVEGELGTIGGTEEGIHVAENDKVYTRPEDAVKFVEATGVDALAIAIGTNHGQFKSKTEVNIPLLKEIDAVVDVPLVIHGGTGVKEEDYPELINNGIGSDGFGEVWNNVLTRFFDRYPIVDFANCAIESNRFNLNSFLS